MSDYKWTYYADEAAKIGKRGKVSDSQYDKLLFEVWDACDKKQKELFSRIAAALRGSGESVFPILDELAVERDEEKRLENILGAATWDDLTGMGRNFPSPNGGFRFLPHLTQTNVEKYLNAMR